MRLPKVREYINNLKTGAVRVELNQEEKRGYFIFKKANGKEATKEEYLIGTLEARIAIQEHFNKVESCKKKRHLGEKVLSYDSSNKALCYCYICGDMYNRPMTSEEHANLNKKMNEPYTI